MFFRRPLPFLSCLVRGGNGGAQETVPAGVQPLSSLAGWVWCLLRERRRQAIRVVALSLAASTLALLQPCLLRTLIDDGALRADLTTLAGVCLLMATACLVGLGIESVSRFDYLALSSHVLFRLRERVFVRLQELPPTYYARTTQGDILARFDGDVAEVQRFFVDAPLALLNGLFALLIGIALLLSMHPGLTLLVLAVTPFQMLAALSMRDRLEASTRAVREQASGLSSHFLDSLRAMKFVQTTHTGASRLHGLQTLHTGYHAALHANQQAGFRLNAAQKIIGLLGQIALFGAGGYLLATGELSVGALLAFVMLAPRVAGALQTLAGVHAGWQRCHVSVARLQDILGEKAYGTAGPARLRADAPGNSPERTPEHALRGDIVLDGVTFGYDAGHHVLEQAHACFPGGQKTVLLGASGEGKSTLVDLLLGHYQPIHGEIRIGGLRLADLDPAWWRQRVAVVDQEPVFFSGSVRQNLLHVRPQASEAEMVAALLASAYASLPLPDGLLDTPVGAAAHRLSRGQRMRLALARALLQQPDILILDETTSAVDERMGRSMLECVDQLFATATRLVITHQPQGIAASDHVHELRNGRLLDWRRDIASGRTAVPRPEVH